MTAACRRVKVEPQYLQHDSRKVRFAEEIEDIPSHEDKELARNQ